MPNVAEQADREANERTNEQQTGQREIIDIEPRSSENVRERARSPVRTTLWRRSIRLCVAWETLPLFHSSWDLIAACYNMLLCGDVQMRWASSFRICCCCCCVIADLRCFFFIWLPLLVAVNSYSMLAVTALRCVCNWLQLGSV